MVQSEVDISNEALNLVSVSGVIDDLDDPTTEAAACKRHYARARDAALQAFPWPFATRRSTLALRNDVTRTDWTYVYALPSDCIAPRYIVVDGERTPMAEERIEFAIESVSGDTKILLSDEKNAILCYTARVTTVTVFSDLFVDALVANLASRIATALIKGKPGLEVRQLAMNEYMRLLNEAASASQREEFREEPITPSLAARGVTRPPRWRRF